MGSSLIAKTKSPDFLVYEATPRYDLWLKLVIGGILALTLVVGIVLISVDMVGAAAMFGGTAFDALLFHAFIPRRYQVFRDRVRIALGRPFALSIPLYTIKEARPASGSKAFAYRGLRFATSTRTLVEIVRSQGWNVVISPTNRDAFLHGLTQALKTMQQSK